MAHRQEMRSEETKAAILAAAAELFSQKGFDAVSIREIAKAAGCSHTTLYIYFKDKEALLYELSVSPLQSLQQQMEHVLCNHALSHEERLTKVSSQFIQFCLLHRTMYTLFFMVKASRIDVEAQPGAELQSLRTKLFDLLQIALLRCLPDEKNEERALAFARIYFYTLHGIIGTYTKSEETMEQLMERLAPTFEMSVEVVLKGCKQLMAKGEGLE
ncbi:TetR/AcrR family transcriptional regulator [Brevibacillus nitrificans]|uniref:TetR/AcrR family transcriptional regulator n=1 Tax=Brevibacillus nitrificans TaxID=651560 RepID=UPI0028669949|nr:TetR/AcrR family transcriptional regulator [Brevibacillus nitrificans]MDR7316523.1 AcrR family transcriptional regulator [Brevibacillus nitrificans]